MPANLKESVFGESCCDGGASGLNDQSAQSCGCDKGANWVCERHREVYKILQDGRDAFAREAQKAEDEMNREILMRDTVPAMGYTSRFAQPVQTGWAERQVQVPPSTGEVRIVDPTTGGAKGQKLARYDLMPPDALWELALVYGMGSQKYADRNWEKGYKWGLSVGALERHLARWKMGQSRDDEAPLDGAHHLAQVMWHAAALLVFELRGLGTDDVRLKRG